MQGVDTADGLAISVIGRGLIKDRAPEVEFNAKNRRLDPYIAPITHQASIDRLLNG